MLSLLLLCLGCTAAQADTLQRDTVDTPSGGLTVSAFGYQHAAVSGSIVRATLGLTAFDIDSNETVSLYAYDNGSLLSLGTLNSTGNNRPGLTFFTLPTSLYDDVASGLSLYLTITHSGLGLGAFALTRSALTTVVASVPEASSELMLVLGLGVLALSAGAARKGRRQPAAA